MKRAKVRRHPEGWVGWRTGQVLGRLHLTWREAMEYAIDGPLGDEK